MSNQASEVKHNSLNKSDEDVKLERIESDGGRKMLSSFGVSFEQAEQYIQDRVASVSNMVSSNNRPITASHEYGQVDIVHDNIGDIEYVIEEKSDE